nr:hypothetical protein [Caballeronia sp. ATUFL_M2_KS44]
MKRIDRSRRAGTARREPDDVLQSVIQRAFRLMGAALPEQRFDQSTARRDSTGTQRERGPELGLGFRQVGAPQGDVTQSATRVSRLRSQRERPFVRSVGFVQTHPRELHVAHDHVCIDIIRRQVDRAAACSFRFRPAPANTQPASERQVRQCETGIVGNRAGERVAGFIHAALRLKRQAEQMFGQRKIRTQRQRRVQRGFAPAEKPLIEKKQREIQMNVRRIGLERQRMPKQSFGFGGTAELAKDERQIVIFCNGIRIISQFAAQHGFRFSEALAIKTRLFIHELILVLGINVIRTALSI